MLRNLALVKLGLGHKFMVSTFSAISGLKKFDVFTRSGKGGSWAYRCSVEAKSIEHAKNTVLNEHGELKRQHIAVYPKR